MGNQKNKTVLCKLSDKLTSLWKSSYSSSLICNDNGEIVKNSVIINVIKKIPFKKHVSTPVKMFFSKSVDNSFFIKNLLTFFEYLLSLSLKCYGAFSISFVAVSFLFNVLNHSQNEKIALYSSIAVISLFPTLFFSKSISVVISESRFLSNLFFNLLKCEKLLYYAKNKSKGSVSGAIIAGFVVSFFTLAFSRVEIIITLLLLVLSAIFMCRPETALLLTSLIYFFCPRNVLLYLISVALISYFVKVVRGKRTLYFTLNDLPPVGFILLFLFFNKNNSELFIVVVLTLSYFFFSGIATNVNLVVGCLKNLSISATIYAIYNLFVFFWNASFDSISDIFIVTAQNKEYFSTSTAMFYAFAIIFFIYSFASKKEKKRVLFISVLINFAALYFGGNGIGIIVCIIAIMFMTLNVSKNKILVIIFSSALITLFIKVISFFPTFYPDIFRNSFFTEKYLKYVLSGVKNSSLIYTAEGVSDSGSLWLQLGFWGGLLAIITIFSFCLVFIRNGIQRKRPESFELKILSVTISCIALAYTLFSFGCFTWADLKGFGVFWIIGGISSSIRRISTNEKNISSITPEQI